MVFEVSAAWTLAHFAGTPKDDSLDTNIKDENAPSTTKKIGQHASGSNDLTDLQEELRGEVQKPKFVHISFDLEYFVFTNECKKYSGYGYSMNLNIPEEGFMLPGPESEFGHQVAPLLVHCLSSKEDKLMYPASVALTNLLINEYVKVRIISVTWSAKYHNIKIIVSCLLG